MVSRYPIFQNVYHSAKNKETILPTALCFPCKKSKKRSEAELIDLGPFSVQFTVILFFLTFEFFVGESGKIFDYFYFFCDIRQTVKAI